MQGRRGPSKPQSRQTPTDRGRALMRSSGRHALAVVGDVWTTVTFRTPWTLR